MLVSLVVPCYQERDFIRGCIASIQRFVQPADVEMEILVLDGMSTDGTRDILRELSERDPRIQVLDNPARYQSAALNTGIAAAKGELILRMDVHSVYGTDYLARCVETSRRTGAANVGGVAITLPRGTGYQAALVQALTTHRFGVGNSGFRVGSREGPADTVVFGCYRASVFHEVGLFDERLVRAQDYEFNRRLAKAGHVVWLNPAIQVMYYQQPDLRSFFVKQVAREAPYNAYMWYVAPYAFAFRHAVTALFTAGVLGGMALYAAVPWTRPAFLAVMAIYGALALAASGQQARRYRRLRHILVLPMCFFAYHFLHGAGVLGGVLRLATRTSPVQRRPRDARPRGGTRAGEPTVSPP